MNIQAKLYKKFDTAQVTESFKKREFVVEYAENPMYPQFLKFQLIQEKCELLDHFEPGQMVEVSFNLRGREWTSPQGEVKYFNSLDAWRISPVVAQDPAAPPASDAQATQDQIDVSSLDDSDDLPF